MCFAGFFPGASFHNTGISQIARENAQKRSHKSRIYPCFAFQNSGLRIGFGNDERSPPPTTDLNRVDQSSSNRSFLWKIVEKVVDGEKFSVKVGENRDA